MKNIQLSKQKTSKNISTILFQDESCKVLSKSIPFMSLIQDLLTLQGIKEVTEDLSVKYKPTIKYRFSSEFFLSVFHVIPEEMGIEGLEQASQNIVENYIHESRIGVSTWILCVANEGVCLQIINSNTDEDQRGLLTIPNQGENINDINFATTVAFKEIASAVGEIELAKKFGVNIADQWISALTKNQLARLQLIQTQLGWGLGSEIKTDLPKEVSSCFCFSELGGSLSDGIVLFVDYPLTGASGARKAYDHMSTIADNLRLSAKNIMLGIVFGEQEALVFSPGRNRDTKLPLTIDRLKEYGWVRNSLYNLLATNLPKNNRDEIDIDKIFQSGELDSKFYDLCTDFRLCLIERLLDEQKIAIGAISQFDNENAKRKIQLTDIATNHDLQAQFLAIVDSLVLRTILHRFIEVYHGVPFQPTHDEMLGKYGRKQSKQKHEVGDKRKGKLARFIDPYELVKSLEKEFKDQFLQLDKKYEDKYGGDIHFSKMAKAVRYLEENIDSTELFDLLDLTNQKRYSFHYEDLRPDALENFYQRSLETAIVFKKSNGNVTVSVENSKKARKELGAYYTPAVAAKFAVTHSLTQLLNQKDDQIENAFDKGDQTLAGEQIVDFLFIRICDPTVGGGSFLKECFRQFADIFWFNKLLSWHSRLTQSNTAAVTKKIPWYKKGMKFSDFENHVLTHCLYGVDIDLKALSIASQTLTLEALNYLEGEERFPNFININLKVGNTFVSYFENEDEWKSLDPKVIQSLLRVRESARYSRKHDELEALQVEERKLLAVIYTKLADQKHKKWELDISDLKPFCWQIEFPEVFFNNSGKSKESCGFDCIVGNPPWENIKPFDEDFFESIDPEWETGKNKKVWQTKRISTLRKSPEIEGLYQKYLHNKTLFNELLNVTEQYTLLEPTFEHVGGGNGDSNTYKLACEHYLKILSKNGAFGFLVPEGFTGDKGTRDLRKYYLSQRVLKTIIAFNKKNEIFPDAMQSFCILNGGTFEKIHGYMYATDLVTRADLINLKVENWPLLSYSTNISDKIETMPFFSIKQNIESQIIEKILKFDSPARSQLPWPVNPYTELDTTNDFEFTKNPCNGYFVCKGENMDRFQSPSNLTYGLNIKSLRSKKKWAKNVDTERVGWRSIAGTNDPRRMISSIIQPGVACFNSLRIIEGPTTSDQRHFLVGVLNSFCYEYFIRLQSKNNNINVFLVMLSPMPRLGPENSQFVEVVKLSKELNYKNGSLTKRKQIEAKLEALVAGIYGFSNEEFQFILSSFDGVPEDYRSLVLAEFQGKRLKAA